MSDQTTFESRLAAALQRRADVAPTTVDAAAVARVAVTARPSVGIRLFGVTGWRNARLALVIAILGLLVVASLVIGSQLLSPAPKLDLGRLVPAGEMTIEREGHTATRLLDGRVLLVGGDDPPSADLYDPTTGIITRTGTMTTAQRFGMAAALLADGKVLIVGGTNMEGDDVTRWPLTFGEVYDPVTKTFSRTGPMVQPRQHLRSALTLPDGKVLIVGGDVPDAPPGATSSNASRRIAQVELYDPATNTFEPRGSLVFRRTAHSLSLLADGTVLVAGGWGDEGPMSSTELYDPSTGTSRLLPDMTIARANHAAVPLADGRVLLVAGNGPAGDTPPLASVEVFDPGTGTFHAVGRLITERSGATATRLDDGRVLVAGGTNVDGDPRTVEIFDPAAGTSSVVGRVDPGQDVFNGFSVVSTVLLDGSVLLSGGNGVSVTRFDPTLPAAGTPVATPATPVGFVPVEGSGVLRTGHTATRLLDGRILIAGGTDGGTSAVLSSAEIFDPATGATKATSSMGVPRTGHVAATLPDGRVLIAAGLGAADVSTSWPSAELHDPATGTFSPVGVMTIAADPVRGGGPHQSYEGRPAAVALTDGRVLIAGWDPGKVNAATRSLQTYDPVAGTITAVELPARVLVRGARSVTLLPDGRVLFLDGDRNGLQAQVYDPIADAWELGATTTGREMFATTVFPDGQVLIAGGKLGSTSRDDESIPTAETWSPVSGAFSTVGVMEAGHIGGSATLLPGGRVLISGGHDHRHMSDGTGRPNEHPAPELWDPISRTFSPAGTMAAERSEHTATLLDDGRVLLFGGVTRLPDRNVPDPPAAELYVGP